MNDHTYYSRMPAGQVGGRVNPTRPLVELLAEYQMHLEAIQALERAKQEVFEKIAVKVKAADHIGNLATWKAAKPIDRVRGAELSVSHPRIYEEFVNRPPRRLLKVSLAQCEEWLRRHPPPGEQ